MSQRAAINARQTPGESPDPTPIEVPGLQRPLTLREEMRRFVREELSKAAQDQGAASFEEEDDFSDDETDAFATQYTVHELRELDQVDDLEGNPDAGQEPGSRSEPVTDPPPGDPGGEAAQGSPEGAPVTPAPSPVAD